MIFVMSIGAIWRKIWNQSWPRRGLRMARGVWPPCRDEVRAPYPKERDDNPCKVWLAIYEIIFLLELTFPMLRLASTVLVYYQITMGQLMHNSWRVILGVQGLVDQEEDFQALYFLKQNSYSKVQFAVVKRCRNTLKFEEITNSDHHWKNCYAVGCGLVNAIGYPWKTPLVCGRPDKSSEQFVCWVD